MIWIFTILGILIGAAIGELSGAVVLGFIGWLTGVIVKSLRQKPGSVPGPSRIPEESLETRIARLEAAVARLEAQLSGSVIPDAAPAPTVVPDAAVAATVGEPAPPAPRPFAAKAEPGSPPVAAAAAPGMTQAPPPPREPPKPNPIVAWLTGGNTIARVGLLILFFGFAFLLKYAADNEMLPPELRVAGVAAAGVVLLVLGWRLRHKREAYALGMQGAGVAVLYLTTFAAMKMYQLLPPEMAFFLLAGIAVFSAALAILQDSAALAVIGAGGGFLAPVLASSGGGSHVMLFSYYLVLNLGIAAIAWYKAWRSLNLTGFVFTFLIFLAWGWDGYNPEIFASTEFFLVAFFLVYVAIAVMVARRYVDTTLVFGVPLAAFALQSPMMQPYEYGLAFSALVVAALYILLAWRLGRAERGSWKLLSQSFLALGIVFATLAIPLALDARWTSASWALEGAAIIWIGLRQQRTIARYFGLLLQLGAGCAYVIGYHHSSEDIPLVDAAFIGAVLIALAAMFSHRLLLVAAGAPSKFERLIVKPLFAWGLAWAIFAGLNESDVHLSRAYEDAANILFLSGLALVFGILSRRLDWSAAAWTARALLPVLFLPAIAEAVLEKAHPLRDLGWLAWPAAIATVLWVLRNVLPDRRSAYTTFLHAGTMVLAAFIGAQELHWIASHYTARGTAWSVASVIVAPAILVLMASSRAADTRWPVAEHTRAYRYNAALFIAIAFAVWSLFANMTHDARSDPLPYLPFVNALDLGHILAGFSLAFAWLALRRSNIAPPESLTGRGGLAIAGGLGFIWLTAVLLRTLSHWADVPYNMGAMTSSVLVQASLSIFWAILALAAMVYATRTARRGLWFIGAVLMAVVVGKLFIIDLSNVGGIERIVSFIAVGVLMLVIGYFSPVPPRKAEPTVATPPPDDEERVEAGT